MEIYCNRGRKSKRFHNGLNRSNFSFGFDIIMRALEQALSAYHFHTFIGCSMADAIFYPYRVHTLKPWMIQTIQNIFYIYTYTRWPNFGSVYARLCWNLELNNWICVVCYFFPTSSWCKFIHFKAKPIQFLLDVMLYIFLSIHLHTGYSCADCVVGSFLFT